MVENNLLGFIDIFLLCFFLQGASGLTLSQTIQGHNGIKKIKLVSKWSGWSKCSHSCGAGNQQRQRYVINEAQHGGLPCPEKDAMRETQICKLKDCPVDCQVSEWSSWSKCSQSCDIGNQKRQRYVLKKAQHGGLPCPEEQSMKEMRTCTMMDCPMDCEISEWSSWSACSQSCGDGTQERRRHISRPLQYGDVPCPDVKKLKESRICKLSKCWSNYGRMEAFNYYVSFILLHGYYLFKYAFVCFLLVESIKDKEKEFALFMLLFLLLFILCFIYSSLIGDLLFVFLLLILLLGFIIDKFKS
ncbi:spondin-1-like [Clavelina lepadiformis]|uniref:spondin-1-like n=1 Tax=Clavelina lepadiformis TaxID=159417 RepID=UPI004041C04F